jgi:glycosyltransferase involved in cell wall biosynthesis
VATGLRAELTGIERLVVDTVTCATRLFEMDNTVLVEPGSDWVSAIPDSVSVIELDRRRAAVARRPRWPIADSARTGTVIHSFAAPFPSGTHGFRRSYTVHDWGPFYDGAMAPSARAAWVAAMVRGIRGASLLHFMASTTKDETPALLRPWVSRTPGVFGLPYAMGPSGAADENARNRRSPGLVLSVGTHVPRKRFSMLVDACSRIEGATLELVGGATDSLQVAPGRTGRGRVSEIELQRLYSTADLFVLVSTYEGFGLPAIEASRAGCRLLLSRAVARRLPPQVVANAQVVPDEISAVDLGRAIEWTLQQRVPAPQTNLAIGSGVTLLDLLARRVSGPNNVGTSGKPSSSGGGS